MAERLKINGGNLRQGHASLVAAKEFFDLLSGDAGEAAGACGHPGLAGELRSAADNWSIRRGKLAEALGNLAGHLDNAINTFGNVDDELARMMTGEGSGAGGPSAAATSGSDTRAQDPGPLPSPSSPGGQSAPAPGGAFDEPVGPEATAWRGGSAAAGDGGHPAGQAPLAASPPVGSDPKTQLVPEGSEPLGLSPGMAHPHLGVTQRGGLTDASLDDLLHALVAKWRSLGGTEKALLAALAGTGLAGLILGATKPGSKLDARGTPGVVDGPPSALDPGAPGESGQPVSRPDVDPGPLPEGTLRLPDDPALDEALGERAEHPDPSESAPALPGQEAATDGVRAEAAEAVVAGGTPARLADLAPLTAAGPGQPAASPGPELVPMPSLETDAAPAAASLSASTPAVPDLTASPVPGDGPSLAPLPSLDRDGGEAVIAAGAAPLGVAALGHAGSPSLAAPAAPLPSLAAAGGGASAGSVPGSHAHSGSQGQDRDARKTLDDLKSPARKDSE